MSRSLSRRAVLGAAIAIPVTAVLPREASAATTVPFTLNAVTLDGGEQVVSLTLHTKALGKVNPASVTTDTFSVHAKATSPIPVVAPDMIFSEYDLDREVVDVSVDNKGNITLDLYYKDQVTGGGTLGYILSKGTNVPLDLVYTITQNEPLVLHNKRSVTITKFVQGEVVNAEVDRFSYGKSAGGMNYRLFSPVNNGHGRAGKHPLVVWLHGGGEGGAGGAFYTNEATLRANRGALGFATDWGQRIFGGAYVVAPQCITAWMADGGKFAPEIMALIKELIAKYRVDTDRIHVLGCSNGGYMTLKMETEYPEFFASGVPICPGATPNFFSDEDLRRCSSTPTWFVHSKDDTTLPYEPNTIRASKLIDDSIVTLYDHVIWDGIQYPGHWSWIYVGHNDPQYKGQHLYQWMAAQEA